MNVRQAMEQLMAAARAYGMRTAEGAYRVPPEAQRPVYLVGPPGVGKTALAAQAARNLGIGYAAYTMTHHTRQSAIGLPAIVHRVIGGEERAVTEYTMSEIVAEVWARAEAGSERGMLFLDEINCVSESLMPAMLQLLQYKTFGAHPLPEGWMIVCAGNPTKYNRYAHTFDPVALDRLRVIEVEPDLEDWLDYAARRGVHPSVRAYLRLRPEDFYATDGDRLVTARSWTDLSDMMLALESGGGCADAALFGQYLQLPEVAERFSLFHRMHDGLRLRLEAVLAGEDAPGPVGGGFDERLFAALLLSGRLGSLAGEAAALARKHERLANFAAGVGRDGGDAATACREHIARQQAALEARKRAGALDAGAEAVERARIAELRRLSAEAAPGMDRPSTLAALEAGAAEAARPAAEALTRLDGAIERGFDFLERALDDPNLRLICLNDLKRGPAWDRIRRAHRERFDALWDGCDPEARARRALEDGDGR